MVNEMTTEMMNLVNNKNFRALVANTAKENGMTAEQWNSDRKFRLALYMHFAQITVTN